MERTDEILEQAARRYAGVIERSSPRPRSSASRWPLDLRPCPRPIPRPKSPQNPHVRSWEGLG